MWYDRPRHFLAGRFSTETFLGLELTVTLIVTGGCIWLFGALVDAVLDNATMVRWDIAADGWIHDRVTTSGLAVFQKISEIGSPTTMTIVCIIGSVLLLKHRHMIMLITWIAAFAGSGLLGRVLKLAVHRGRPTFGTLFLTDQSYSFPSGHSIGAFAGVAMILLVVRQLGLVKGRKYIAMCLAGSAFVILVGVSRVYLGVHFPSDVIGGFAVSAAWVAICVTVAGIVLHRRGRTLSS